MLPAKRVDACITGTVKSSSSAPRATARRTGNSSPEVKGNGSGGTWPKTQRIGYELFARSAGKNVAGESAFIMPNRFWSAISAICARAGGAPSPPSSDKKGTKGRFGSYFASREAFSSLFCGRCPFFVTVLHEEHQIPGQQPVQIDPLALDPHVGFVHPPS